MKETPDEQTEHTPDFVFGGKRIVSEATWPEYEAQGVSNITAAIPEDDEKRLREELERRGRDYGAENLLLGDAFDVETGRPFHHKPGIGVYATAAGVERHRLSHTPVLRVGDRSFVLRSGETGDFSQPDVPPSADKDSGKS
jgi:hypothetical protein